MKDGTVYSIMPARLDQWDDAMEMAYRVFLKFESKEYGKEGTDSFVDFITNPKLITMFKNGLYIVYLAMVDEKIVGIISLRSGNHISLLFVDKDYHRKGIAAALIKTVQDNLLRNTEYEKMTVNASPYGIPFYEKMGFKSTGEQTVIQGMIITPMELYL